jgi:hypothetical protein
MHLGVGEQCSPLVLRFETSGTVLQSLNCYADRPLSPSPRARLAEAQSTITSAAPHSFGPPLNAELFAPRRRHRTTADRRQASSGAA